MSRGLGDVYKRQQGQRDAGFQIFYVFINIGSLVAPFLAPMLRSWWLGTKGFTYNADLPKLCHDFINGNIGNNIDNLRTLTEQVGGNASDLVSFCPQYLDAFNTGIHYSFIVSVLMMLVSLAIFVFNLSLIHI